LTDPVAVGFHEYQGYRYSVTVVANGSEPRRVEAELWWSEPNKDPATWHYFRRSVAATALEAVRQVEADFKAWVEEQREPPT
jgi:hypothetical protein